LKKPLVTAVCLVAATFIGYYVHSEYIRAKEAPAKIQAGFDAIHAESVAETNRLREDNIVIEMDLIKEAREGYAHPTQADIQKDLDDLEWMRPRISSGTPHGPAALHDVDRDIAWCRKHLHPSRP
jgi:hypothetical protein